MSSRRNRPDLEVTVAETTGDAPPPATGVAPSGGPFFLIVTGTTTPSAVGQVVPLAAPACVIGRGRAADLRLDDSGLSREHVRIVRDPGGGHHLLDMGSTNGTFVNGVRVRRATLGEGDRIQIGRATSLRYSSRARLQPREEQVRRALTASGVGTWEWQPEPQRLVLSEDSERLLGLGKLAHPDPMALVHAEDRERVGAALERGLAEGACEVEFRLAAPGAPPRWVSLRGEVFRDEDGAAARLAGALVDITAHKEAAEALRRQALIFESISDAAVVLDLHGAILEWNPGAERMLGVSRSEAVGRDPGELEGVRWPGELSSELIRGVSGAGSWRGEVELGRRGGGSCTAEVVAAPVLGPDGALFACVAICRDVGERRRVEAHLQMADRLAGLWRIAAGLAHQINSPLAALSADLAWARGAFQKLPLEGPEARELAEVLGDMGQSLGKIGAVVRDLTTLSLGERSDETRPVDVSRLVEMVVRVTAGEVGARARVQCRLEVVPPVLASEGRLDQAIQNVLVEAAKRMDPAHAGRNEITVSTRLEGATVVVEVADNGPVIGAEDLLHLFDPFHRIAVERPGSSLALSVALSLVQAAGGNIEVRSDAATGTVARISLPAMADA